MTYREVNTQRLKNLFLTKKIKKTRTLFVVMAEEQLYAELVFEYVENQTSPDLTEEDAERIASILDGKTDLESVKDVDIYEKEEGVYGLELPERLEGLATDELTYAREAQQCVTHGNSILEGEPPEGMTTDGNGNHVGGMR